jgi:hypothetical protein
MATEPPRFRRQRFRPARGEIEALEIGTKAPLDAGPQHLHGDRPTLAGGQNLGTMHLRDRGRRHRRAERGEDVAQRLAERGCHRRFGFGLRERRHLVLQAFEVARHGHADDVGPRGQELAELDVSGAEPRERRGDAVRGFRRARTFPQPGERERAPRGERQRRRIDQAEHAFAGEDEAGTSEAEQMGESGDHKRQPECSATTPPVICRNDTRRKPAAPIISANCCGRGKLRIDSTR